jgi:CRISPR/Cas system endoribonuclease Cas6 (RAMP superfamily)
MYNDEIMSPYTITLGDEFQGFVRSLKAAIKTIYFLEETLLEEDISFKLRYVVVFDKIETPINIEIAGMTGPGLAMAREMLTKKQLGKSRFQFKFSYGHDFELNMLFRLVESLISCWNKKDYILIKELLCNDDDKSVAEKFTKNRSQVWKRRKTLRIEEYIILKKLIFNQVQILGALV